MPKEQATNDITEAFVKELNELMHKYAVTRMNYNYSSGEHVVSLKLSEDEIRIVELLFNRKTKQFELSG
jgi:hypothetical protein